MRPWPAGEEASASAAFTAVLLTASKVSVAFFLISLRSKFQPMVNSKFLN